MKDNNPTTETERRLVICFYTDEIRAQKALQKLIDAGFPLDRVSLLGKTSASGDDPLGVYYPTTGERVRGWGRLGALWGGALGMLGGAAGMFVIPGIGTMMVLGPIAEILAGAVAGAGLGGGLMAGGAALSEVAIAAHRMGVPETDIDDMERRLRANQYLLLLIVHEDEVDEWQTLVDSTEADKRSTYPYVGIGEAVVNFVKE